MQLTLYKLRFRDTSSYFTCHDCCYNQEAKYSVLFSIQTSCAIFTQSKLVTSANV